MKKPALIILGLLLLAFISIYYIIPQNIIAKSVVNIDGTDANVAKFIIEQRSWKKWWPGSHNGDDSTVYTNNGVIYKLLKSTNGDIQVQIKKGDKILDSHITYLAVADGETQVTWYASQQSSLNIFGRIAGFVKIKEIQTEMSSLLSHFKQFMQKDVNVYGMKVNLKKVTDETMLATNTTTKTYPTTANVYSLIANVKKQIAAKGVKESNQPMLNIFKVDNNEYQVMVAIPINKAIMPDAGYVVNHMLKGGNILEAEVKGGRKTIDNAMAQLKNYTRDHHLTPPAMPYELIITDRQAQTDTAKWITKIYYPIF
ncbi:hypothetical protein [Mucilaginibacter glaciei]|uniref:AraC effector-binding domain-containing protein n=1 Tax=Mucilaginibacter glaciei TaxID=2772109 RepID=A0A926S7N5_9SPHI|nr:hypothetical protein [Mucilaginibacter glaciei]MBD1394871.1 hypothetical protein [Mucilaginibacter glaciei]